MNDNLTESEFQEIIRKISNGEISFPKFLDELTQRGINEYEIDVATGQATYKGVHSEFKTDSQVSLVNLIEIRYLRQSLTSHSHF